MAIRINLGHMIWLVLVVCLPQNIVLSQDSMFSRPNTEGWINPDDLYSPKYTSELDSSEIPLKNVVKQKEILQVHTENLSESEPSSVEKDEDILEQNIAMKSLEEAKGAKMCLQRFVNLLLEVADLNTGDVQTENKVSLELSFSSNQLLTLRQFAKDGNLKEVPLRKLDEIFSAVFAAPFIKLPSFQSFLGFFPSFEAIFSLWSTERSSFIISALLPSILFIFILTKTKSLYKTFVWFTPVVFVTSYLNTASLMFKEAQLKNYEEISKYPDIPSTCRKSSWLSWSFSEVRCSTYLKAHHIDPNLGITPMKIITKMFGEIIGASMGHLGLGLVEFFNSFQDLGFFDRIWLVPVASAILYFCFILVSLVLSGGSIRLPFFMGSLNFSNSQPVRNVVTTTPIDHGELHVRTAKNLEAAPPVSGITLNFNSSANFNEFMQTIQGVRTLKPPMLATSNEHDGRVPQLPSSSLACQDFEHNQLAAGDAPQANPDLGSSSRGSSHLYIVGSKKIHKPFLHLNSKYKAGNKVGSKSISRARHMSL